MKINPFLMFNDSTAEAVDFYTSVFKNSKVISTTKQNGKVKSAIFELHGQRIMAFDGGPHFKFSDGMSLFVSCDTQAEIDELWDRLSDGGEKRQCGWVKDRFGVSWQIVPAILGDLLGDPDPDRATRALQAMLEMHKLDIAALKRAADSA